MTLAERFDLWAQQYEEKGLEKGIEKGIKKGIEKGIAKGEALVLERLLSKRFGPLPPEIAQLISTASPEEVETWLDRLLDAPSLGEIFKP